MDRKSILKVHTVWVNQHDGLVPWKNSELVEMLVAASAGIEITADDLDALTTAIWEGRDGDVLPDGNNWAETDDVVEDGNECPECGEARVDWLICGDDDTVKCATCGTVYALEAVEEG